MVVALIDADGPIYRIALMCQTPLGEDMIGNEKLGRSMVNAYVNRLKREYDHFVFTFTDSDHYWRRDVYPDYKMNRRNKDRPVDLKYLREYAMKQHESVLWDNLEADDVLGILATSGEYPDCIVVSIDKDLDTIPCLRQKEVYGPVYRVSEAEAERNHMIQAFTGDTVDGYPGCWRVGPGTARKLLYPYLKGKKKKAWAWKKMLETYEKKKHDAEYALSQARCAYILRCGDFDVESGEVKLWQPPV